MPRDEAALLDIVRAARRCLEISRRLGEAGFLDDLDAQGNMLYWLVVLGEAVRRLSEEFRQQHAKLPWHQMTGMCNRLVHEYDNVDLHIVWRTVRDDLPSLVADLEPLVPPEPD